MTKNILEHDIEEVLSPENLAKIQAEALANIKKKMECGKANGAVEPRELHSGSDADFHKYAAKGRSHVKSS
jgi:hypothetical protein